MSKRRGESKRLKLERETGGHGLSGGRGQIDPNDSRLAAGVQAGASDVPRTLAVAPPELTAVESAIVASREWLLERQNPEGYWVAELEADTTLESYFILFKWFFGHPDDPKIPRLARVLREAMLPGGGWNIYHDGPAEISISCLSYLALKLAGIPADAPDMQRSRDAILAMGGVTKANTYTKYYLAFFEQYDWAHVPAIPPEMILVPTVSPFHISDMSSWSRTIFVPLSVIYAIKPTVKVPKERGVDELFIGGRENSDLALQRDEETITWKNLFLFADRALKLVEKAPIAAARDVAVRRAEKWIIERFPKSGGLSAILPAMMNSMIALKALGYKEDHPHMQYGIHELDMLEIERDRERIEVQPCVSPVWDTCISVYALEADRLAAGRRGDEAGRGVAALETDHGSRRLAGQQPVAAGRLVLRIPQ